MTTQNIEFTKRLRASIKTKLEEFGLDVDEELPDYVLIMIKNKREKKQMEADLKIFLEDNSPAFVLQQQKIFFRLFNFFHKIKIVNVPLSSTLNVDNKQTPNEKNSINEDLPSSSTNVQKDNKKSFSKRKPSKNETVHNTSKEQSSSSIQNLNRCRFWPDCRKEDVCPFHHPTKLCTTFPNCEYGDKCLFVHPSCKFLPNCKKLSCPYMHNNSYTVTVNGKKIISITLLCKFMFNCTRSNCPYVHCKPAFKKPQSPMMPLSQLSPPAKPTGLTSTSTIACRYGGRCQNLKCFYKHPPMCRFGAGCTKQGCYFLHRTASSLSKVYNVSAS